MYIYTQNNTFIGKAEHLYKIILALVRPKSLQNWTHALVRANICTKRNTCIKGSNTSPVSNGTLTLLWLDTCTKQYSTAMVRPNNCTKQDTCISKAKHLKNRTLAFMGQAHTPNGTLALVRFCKTIPVLEKLNTSAKQNTCNRLLLRPNTCTKKDSYTATDHTQWLMTAHNDTPYWWWANVYSRLLLVISKQVSVIQKN